MADFDAFIFDVDGTLLDTLPDLTAVTNATLESYGFPLHSQQEILGYVGGGGRRLIELAVPEGTDAATMDAAFELWKRIHAVQGIRLTKEYKGITEALSALRAQGVKLAALSNKFDEGVQELIPRYFPGLFEVMHGECEAIPRKPNPAGLKKTMEELGVTPERTVYVGDSRGDMVVAHAAGTFALGVSWGYQSVEQLEDGGADLVIDTPARMVDILNEGAHTVKDDSVKN